MNKVVTGVISAILLVAVSPKVQAYGYSDIDRPSRFNELAVVAEYGSNDGQYLPAPRYTGVSKNASKQYAPVFKGDCTKLKDAINKLICESEKKVLKAK